MADKRLRTMVFPGLEDTYTIPQDMNDLESIDAVAEPYDEFASYSIGDYCSNGGKLYRCNTAILSGETWNANHWTETNVGDEILAGKAATNTALSGKVSKAGDTMTGTLFVERNVNADVYHAAKTTLYSINEPPTSITHTLYSLVAYDKDSNIIGYLRDYIGTDGSTGVDLNARNLVNGSGNINGISLVMKPDGTREVVVTAPAAWRTALGVPYYTEGSWTPKLYDYNTFKQDLPSQVYFKIGNYYVMLIRISAFPTTTFETMIQIRNAPCATVDGGIVYAGAVNGAGADWTVQGTTGAAYIRPNFAGTISGGIFQMVIFGHD